MPKIGKYWVDKDRSYWPHDTAHTRAKIEDGKVRVGTDAYGDTANEAIDKVRAILKARG